MFKSYYTYIMHLLNLMLQYNIIPKYIYSLNQVIGEGNLVQEKLHVSMLKIESSNFRMMHHQLMTLVSW
jgi:hypothetical protein